MPSHRFVIRVGIVLACLCSIALLTRQLNAEYLENFRGRVNDYVGSVSELLPWHSDDSLAHSEETPAATEHTRPSFHDATTFHDVAPAVSPALHLPSLKSLCQETEWTPDFWLHCVAACGPDRTSFCGGLNNARNRFQTCVRWAIDAGAGLILPSVTMRGDKVVDVNGGEQCLDSWWDLEALQSAVSANCPQLQLRTACGGTTAEAFVPGREHKMVERGVPGDRGHPVLREARTMATPDVVPRAVEDPVVFEYGDGYLGWNYRASGELETIRKELHQAIPFQRYLLQLGDTITQSPQLNRGAFIGVHLRGESDWPADWGNADQQMVLYGEEIARIRSLADGQDVTAVYVSSGDPQAIQSFRDKLEPMNVTVHDKWTILRSRPEELALVESVDFDSKGIIDFAVLVQAKFYMGVFMSTMSKYVAYSRTANDAQNFFDTYIFDGASRTPDGYAIFEPSLTVRGNHYTSLIVTDGLFIMDYFP